MCFEQFIMYYTFNSTEEIISGTVSPQRGVLCVEVRSFAESLLTAFAEEGI